MTAPRRLVMIGVDAADREFIAAHGDELPNISRLMEMGAGGDLNAEPMSGAVWPSFCTRSPPSEHGIFHHLQWDPAQMRIRRATAEWLPCRPFWRNLGEKGVKVIAFDIPFSFPGSAPNVLEIMNWGSHDLVGPFWANDDKLARRIRAEHGLHPMGFEIPVDKTRAQLERMRDEMIAGAALKARLAIQLMRDRPWDMFLIAFGETHRSGHMMWPHHDDGKEDPVPPGALLEIYKAVDDAVGSIASQAGQGADIVLFALHGMDRNSSHSHLISIFMRRAIARFKGEAAPAKRNDAPGFVRALRRNIPARAQFLIAAAVPQRVRDEVVAREIAGGYVWRDTLGFCARGDEAGYIRFNIMGREAKGALTQERAGALRAFIRSELEALKISNGRSLVRQVRFPAHDWPGARAYLLPDVLVEWEPDLDGVAEEAYSPTLGVIRARQDNGRSGNHRFNGFYTHYGPRQGHQLRPRHISELGALAEALA